MKKVLKIIIIVLIFVGIGVGGAYAYEKLFISPKLNVQLSNLSSPSLVGSAKVINDAKLSNNNISNLKIKLFLSNDSVVYNFDIKNIGSKDAVIDSFVKSKSTCSGVDPDSKKAESDAKTICDGLAYSLTYTSSNTDVKVNDIIKSGETKNITLNISYNGTNLPDNGVNISDINFNMTFKAK